MTPAESHTHRRSLLLVGSAALATAGLLSGRAQADTPFTTFAFPAAGAPTARTLPTRLAEIVNVKDWGAVGDGSTDDTSAIQAALNAAFGTAASPHGSNYYLNKPVFFPAGHYKVTGAGLTLTGVQGAWIFGAGRFSTTIENTAGGNVFTTNALQYSVVERLHLETSSTGTCFNLDYDGLGTWGVSCQSNTFNDIYFDGGSYGVQIGATGANSQGSENLFHNCFFNSHTTAGLCPQNQNALQQTVIGGNFQSCGIGIKVAQGAVPIIHGVGFQVNSSWDIQLGIDADDTTSVMGCRTESDNFIQVGGCMVGIRNCSQVGAGTGTFASLSGSPGFTVETCVSLGGQIIAGDGPGDCRGTIRDCQFKREDWINSSITTANGQIDIFNVRYKGTRDTPVAGGPLFIAGQRIVSSGTKTYTVA